MIEFIASTGSTNRDLCARLERASFVSEGDWLVTDRQTAGVGRSGRVWSDGAGNFMGSTVLHLRDGDPAAQTLALVAGLALHCVVSDLLASSITSPLGDAATRPSALPNHAGLEQPGAGLCLKWPNDLLLEGAKLAGILLERAGDAVVVGIGVNLVSAPSIGGRETTAVACHTGAPPRDVFAERLARQFALDVRRWREFGLAPIVARWIAAALPEGTPLLIENAHAPLAGRFAGLADDGALRLRLGDGTVREIRSGDVRLPDRVRG